ncbi:MAG: hypothetical protein ABI625_23900 [bacterium]
MHDTENVHPYISILDAFDPLTTPVAMRKEREGVAGDLIEDWIVVPT